MKNKEHFEYHTEFDHVGKIAFRASIAYVNFTKDPKSLVV